MLWFRLARSKGARPGSQSTAKCLYRNHEPERFAPNDLILSAGKPTTRINVRRISSSASLDAANGRKKPWTPEEEQALVELRRKGVKWSQMRFHFDGRSTYNLIAHLYSMAKGNGPLADEAAKLKCTRRKGVPLVKADVERAVQLRRQGLSAEQIDKEIGKGHGPVRIRTLIRESAHYLNPRPETSFTPKEDALLAQLASSGKRWSEIARHFPSKRIVSLQRQWHFNVHTKETGPVPIDPDESRRAWSQKEIEDMLEMYQQGQTLRSIAEKLQRHNFQVRWKLNRMGLSGQDPRKFNAAAAQRVLKGVRSGRFEPSGTGTPEIVDKIRQMARAGKSVQETARALVQSTAAVRYWISRENEPRQYRPWSKEDETRLERLLTEGKDLSAVAEELGRTRKSVLEKVRKVRSVGVKAHDAPRTDQTWTADEETKLAGLLGEGQSCATIAEALGRSTIAVYIKISKNRRLGKLPRAKKAPKTAQATESTAEES